MSDTHSIKAKFLGEMKKERYTTPTQDKRFASSVQYSMISLSMTSTYLPHIIYNLSHTLWYALDQNLYY